MTTQIRNVDLARWLAQGVLAVRTAEGPRSVLEGAVGQGRQGLEGHALYQSRQRERIRRCAAKGGDTPAEKRRPPEQRHATARLQGAVPAALAGPRHPGVSGDAADREDFIVGQLVDKLLSRLQQAAAVCAK